MPARTFRGGPGGHRYGFNGKERDKDMHSLTAYDYGFRIYNPAIGRFLSVDPLTQKYPELTPYQFASNNPIEGIDLDGLEYTSSKNPKIYAYIKYDPSLKLVTEVSTSLIYRNFIGYTRSKLLPKYGPPGANWQTYKDNLLIDFAEVLYKPITKDDVLETTLTKSLSSEEMLQEKEGGGKSFTYTSPTVHKQQKASAAYNRNNGKQGVTVNNVEFAGGDRVGAAVSIIGFVAVGVAAFISTDEFTNARNQSNFITGTAGPKIIEWANKGLIPEKFLNDVNLSEIANYLLNGEEPIMTTPAGDKKTNTDLLNFSKKIWSEIDSAQQKKKNERAIERQNYNMSNAGTTDNTAVKSTQLRQ